MAAAGDTSVGGQVIKGGVEGVGDGERDRDRRKGRLGVHGVGPMVQGVGGAKYRHVCTVVSVVVDGGAGGFLATDRQGFEVSGPCRTLTRLPKPRPVVFDLPRERRTRVPILDGATRNICPDDQVL